MSPFVPPEGYEIWTCDFCTAQCNFEAMMQCQRRWDEHAECGFQRDKPESAGGCFEFIVKLPQVKS
jgi:hypothetical protein